MLDANPESVVHYPLIAMGQFNRTLGEIPMEFGGGNRYRVIWAPSRNIMRFTSGISEVVSAYGRNGVEPIDQQLTPTHKAGECWILEQWVNPYRDCTEDQWNFFPLQNGLTRLQTMGPFPRQGYYWRCDNTAIAGEPSYTQVEKMILMVEDGMFRHRPYENFLAIQAKIEQGEKSVASERDARIRNRSLIGGGEAYSVAGGGGGRGTKTINTDRTSRDLKRAGISTKPGTASMMPRRRQKVYDLTAHVR